MQEEFGKIKKNFINHFSILTKRNNLGYERIGYHLIQIQEMSICYAILHK